MNYKEWSSWIDGIEKRKHQRGCMFLLGYYLGLFIFIATRGFLYALGAWVFLKMIGVTL
tara:strand:+ start:367 stop:543 length:177 start_codon:yes stop_codon:yes gene_type:complete